MGRGGWVGVAGLCDGVVFGVVVEEGNFEGDGRAASRVARQLEAVGRAVELLEARARVRESDAAFGRAPRGRGGREPRAVVADLKEERVAASLGAHADVAGRGALRDAVAYGVLDERLKYQVRHAAVEDARVNFEARRQAVVEAHALDLQVAVQEFELASERNLLRRGGVEREAEEVAEPCDHLIGGFRIAVYERGGGVQGVEEEVRAQVHLEGLELGLRRAQFALAVALVVDGGVADEDDDAVDQKLLVEHDEDVAREVEGDEKFGLA